MFVTLSSWNWLFIYDDGTFFCAITSFFLDFFYLSTILSVFCHTVVDSTVWFCFFVSIYLAQNRMHEHLLFVRYALFKLDTLCFIKAFPNNSNTPINIVISIRNWWLENIKIWQKWYDAHWWVVVSRLWKFSTNTTFIMLFTAFDYDWHVVCVKSATLPPRNS